MREALMPELAFPNESRSAEAQSLRVPPHSIEAEQSVLGGLMLDNEAWDDVADLVSEQDFYRQDHRLIFRAVAELVSRNSPCDAVTLSEWLSSVEELDNVGGLAYLGLLARNTPSAANIQAYARIVREHSVLRQLIHIGTQISNSGFSPAGRSVAELLDQAEQLVFKIAEQGTRGRNFANIKELLSRVVDRIDTLYQKGSAITGVPTGYTDIDELTAGLQPSDLIIIAGRPSMGKTTLAMNIAEHVAIKEALPVAIFSMEMPGEQLIMRMLASLGRIDQHRVRTGKLEDEDWPRITSTINMLQGAGLYIDDTAGLGPSELRSRARRLMRQCGQLGLVVIDYLQLMQVPGGSENRATEISEISRSLKGLAKELNVPVVVLSQLNRGVEQRTDKRPQMSDLRESGAIEQDADVIMFIYRDEVYNEDSPDKGKAEIIIAKQRNGPIGTKYLTFHGKYTRFENFAADLYYGEGHS